MMLLLHLVENEICPYVNQAEAPAPRNQHSSNDINNGFPLEISYIWLIWNYALQSWQFLVWDLRESSLMLQLPKPGKIRLGNWEADSLSIEQLQYAATDAFTSWYLYQVNGKLISFSSRTLASYDGWKLSSSLLVGAVAEDTPWCPWWQNWRICRSEKEKRTEEIGKCAKQWLVPLSSFSCLYGIGFLGLLFLMPYGFDLGTWFHGVTSLEFFDFWRHSDKLSQSSSFVHMLSKVVCAPFSPALTP